MVLSRKYCAGILFLFIGAGVLLADEEYHENGEIPCSDCHSMHYGEVTFSGEPIVAGGPVEHMLLAPEDELCLGCHDGTDPMASNVLGGSSVYLPAGWFPRVARGGESPGHTLGTREIAPGSAGGEDPMPMRCITCHDPHGNPYYRNLWPELGGRSELGLTYTTEASGEQQASVILREGTKTSRSSSDMPLFGVADGTGNGAHVSEWCGGCHEMFSRKGGDPMVGGSLQGHRSEDDPWLQHPAIGIPMSVSVRNGHTENQGWFEPHASRLRVASSGDVPGGVRDSDNEITCLTCHAAHGTNNPYSLVYDDQGTVLERDGASINASCDQCHRFDIDGSHNNPHSDPEHGVLRSQDPVDRGGCTQCHVMHGNVSGERSEGNGVPYLLFSDYRNDFCYGGSETGGCHRERPFAYPAVEADRMPEYSDRPGYFEHNDGGVKTPGVDKRKRWPGEQAYSNPLTFSDGNFFSPHANDQDMPLIDDNGQGMCQNCHDVHAAGEVPDLLTSDYGPISGAGEMRGPDRYSLCFDCHSIDGPIGMDPENQRIRDYYDTSINNDLRAGHQIRFNSRVALSWPSNVELGDKLPCYDCHNPHGSLGSDKVNPNGYLLSDEMPGWKGLDDTKSNPEQSRKFCLGCHIVSDGRPGSKTVEGIVMNSISRRKGHYAASTESCHLCHGGDYSTSTSFNVHHPAGGAIALEKEKEFR